MIRTLILSAAVTFLTTSLIPGIAGAATRDVTIGLYLTDARGTCTAINPVGCTEEAQVTGALFTPYYAVLAVFNGDPDLGIAGVSCGIDYDGGVGSGVDVVEWTLCTDGLQFPNGGWPEPGAGNRITWNNVEGCQTNEPDGDGVTAIAGFFYVIAYSDDRMSVIENRRLDSGPEFVVTECNPPVEFPLDPENRAGWLGFSDSGGEEGKLPCVEKSATTWGRIKNTYGN